MALDSEGAQFLIEAMARQYGGQAEGERFNPFDPRSIKPPPGVKTGGAPALAMDDAFGGVAAWANDGLSGLIGAREGFIGFPQLAMLAQRPEYRSPVEIIATEATRKWIKFKAADEAKVANISKIEAEFRRLGVQSVFRQVSEHDGFYGRGHIYIDTGDTDNAAELKLPIGNGKDAMSATKIGKGSLRALRTVEPVWVWPVAYNSLNPLSERWYRPDQWFVMSNEVHKTRLLTFVSREVPDLLKPAYMFGGQSLTQMMIPVVENWLSTRKAVGEIIKKYSHLIFKANMTETINSGNVQNLLRRVALFVGLRNNNGIMLLDKESEDFGNVSVPLSGLDVLQAQAQEHQCSLPRIPQIKLLGIQPAGLNATSEGELRAFEDMIHSYQEAFFRPNLTVVVNLVQLNLFGEIDPGITFDFEPLAEELPAEQAAAAAQQAINGIVAAFKSGIIDRPTSLKEMRNFAEAFGIRSEITDEMIAEAENEPPTPSPEELKAEAEMIRAERGEAVYQ